MIRKLKSSKKEIRQKYNLIKKISILLVFISLIGVSFIIFDSFSYMNQNNIDKKIENHDNYKEKSDDISLIINNTVKTNDKHIHLPINIEIQTFATRILDTMINTWITSNQQYPSISSLSDGNFVVVWQSNLQNGNGWGIYGQIFYSNGAKKGNEFSVNNYNKGNSTNPKVAASSNGKFMVVWQTNGTIISGQIFINDGNKLGTEIQMNPANDWYGSPSITASTNNNFIVSWVFGANSWQIYTQIFANDGTKIGSITSSFSNIPWCKLPSVISLANGNFVITVTCYNNVSAQIFDRNNNIIGTQFPVNIHNSNNNPAYPSISSLLNSNFMIVWQSSNLEIYGQSFTSFGAKIGNEFKIDTYIINENMYPSIGSLVNDNYIVTWQNSKGIYGQILDSTGNKIGREFNLNTMTINSQQNPSVASLINTNFVVVWNSQDSNGNGVFGNIYQSDGSIIGFNMCTPNCQSSDNSTYCKICHHPNFELQTDGLCGCSDGFYLDQISLCLSKFIRFQ